MCVAMATTYCECVTITKIQEIKLSEVYFWYIHKLLAYCLPGKNKDLTKGNHYYPKVKRIPAVPDANLVREQ